MVLSSPLIRLPRTLRISTTALRTFASTPAAALARMQLIGRLAAEPELLPTASGREVIRYAVGVEAGPKGAREVSWFKVASFDEGPRREFVMGLQKGTLVYVDAESRMRTYEDVDRKKRMQLDLVQRMFPVSARRHGARGIASVVRAILC